MTDFHLKPPAASLPRFSWQEAKEKRKKQLAAVRQHRRILYQKLQQHKKTIKYRYFLNDPQENYQ